MKVTQDVKMLSQAATGKWVQSLDQQYSGLTTQNSPYALLEKGSDMMDKGVLESGSLHSNPSSGSL